MVLRIYDCNNYSRRRFETGISVSTVFYEIAYQTDPCILVWDGNYHNARRRKIFPDYKMNRTEPPENMRANQEFLRQMLALTKHTTFQVHYWEADDVIAAIVRQEDPKPVYVVSTDMDFYQLPNVRTDKDPEKVPVSFSKLRLYKALVGDPSDNIKGIPNFGIAAFRGLNYLQELESKLASRKYIAPNNEFVQFGFPKRNWTWLEQPENQKLIQDYYEIIAFIPIPEGELIQGCTPGVENIPAATEIFRSFML